MEIRTLFSPGDEVYYMHRNAICSSRVLSLTVVAKDSMSADTIDYRLHHVRDQGGWLELPQQELYPSIVALIAALSADYAARAEKSPDESGAMIAPPQTPRLP